MKNLAIITSHPIQYYAPVFQLLAKSREINLKVFYTWGENSIKKHDPGFEQVIEWDIPILDGYNYEFLINTAKDQGTHHFKGIINPYAIQKIEQYKPDAILIYGWSLHSHLKIIRYFTRKVPIWFRGDSTLLKVHKGLKSKAKSIIKKIFLNWVYKHIDKAFYVGSNNKAYFKHYGLKEDQLIFSPHATDNNRFSQDRSAEALALRTKLNIPAEDVIILLAGKLEDVKNPKLLLNAWNNLPEKVNQHLVIAGNGMLEPILKASAGLNVHFLNFQNQSQMPVLYQACDLFCLTSLSETWGLVVNEAMACGKPILVSDQVGCAIDLVQNEVNGTIFKSDSPTDLAKKLIHLIKKERQGLKLMGKASFNIIQKWTFENQVKEIEKEIIKLK
ncbi:MAG: glycosyl transferase family 1 [Sphingobacteriales bacterium]|nr:glycosyl transferase family 1 [Sphingobacteriales bacterium]